MIARILPALLLLWLGSCEKAQMTFPGGNLRYLALGDSYTIGESVAANDRWPNQLGQLLRNRGLPIRSVEIVAVTGWTTEELNAGIDQQNPQGTFDLVSLLIGVNNQYRGRTADSFLPEFAALVGRAIQFAGGDAEKVFVVSIPDWGVMPFAADRDRAKIASEIDAFNAVCRAEAARQRVKFIDITTISRQASTQPSLIAADGLHPSAEQYRAWAEVIDASLKATP